MPRFAANLTTLFAELPLAARFEAAARAGFGAVELLFPYDEDPAELRRLLADNDLRLLLINSPPGDTYFSRYVQTNRLEQKMIMATML